jgi:hypothetical protein
VVLADWDEVSTGPREVDLVPTLQARRFGLPTAQCEAFIAAYGRDIRSWAGYQVLHDIRELSTTSALLRDGHTNVTAQDELKIRLHSRRSHDVGNGHHSDADIDNHAITTLVARCRSQDRHCKR